MTRYFTLLFLSFVLILSFQNCGNLERPKAEITHNSVFKDKKVQIEGTGFVKASVNQDEEISYPAGTSLSVGIDMVCIRSLLGNEELMSQKLVEGMDLPEDSEIEFVTWNMEKDYSKEELEDLSNSDDCIYSVSDEGEVTSGYVVNDPQYKNLEHLRKVGANPAWDKLFTKSTKIKGTIRVAVVDSGIDYRHVELRNQVLRDSNGRVIGYDYVNRDSNPMDDLGHGTHVAGILAAQGNNNTGIIGAMFRNIRLIPVKVLNSNNFGTWSNIANGIRYAANKGAKVINVSIYGRGSSKTVEDALRYAIGKGALVFVCAGNDKLNIGSNFTTPASYGSKYGGVITVGSFDADDYRFSSFSNYSSSKVELAAPGHYRARGGIYSTILNNRYRYAWGTSMSTPVAAAAGALLMQWMRSRGLSISPKRAEAILLWGSRARNSLTNKVKNKKAVDLNYLADKLRGSYQNLYFSKGQTLIGNRFPSSRRVMRSEFGKYKAATGYKAFALAKNGYGYASYGGTSLSKNASWAEARKRALEACQVASNNQPCSIWAQGNTIYQSKADFNKNMKRTLRLNGATYSNKIAPFVNAKIRSSQLPAYSGAKTNKSLALALDGGGGYGHSFSNTSAARSRAMSECRSRNPEGCLIYAVNGKVVLTTSAIRSFFNSKYRD